MSNFLKWGLLLAIMIGLQGMTMAQRGAKHEGRKATHQAIKAYAETEIIPVMKPKREAFEQSLSAAEKAEILDIRNGLAALKEETKAMRQAHPRGEKRQEPSEEQRAQVKAFHKRHRQLMTRAWAIADAHEAEIEAIFSSVSEDAQSWRQDIKQIIEENRPSRGEANQPEREHSGHGRKGHHGGKHGKGRMGIMGPIESPVMFVLWDVNEPFPAPTQAQGRNFPNPTASRNVLTYQVEQAGLVKIDLINSQGVVVKQIVNTQQEAGSQRLEVDLSDLDTGVYSYRISTTSGVQVQKVEVR